MTSPPSQEEFNAALRNDFTLFAQKVFATLNPGTPFNVNWHHRAIGHFLEEMRAGKIRRGIMNICPRSAKSTIASVAWPAFVLGHDPTRSFVVVSHGMALAEDLSSNFRKILNSAWYKSAFPTMRGKPDKDNESVFRTSKGGGRRATSVNSDVTGLGGTDIIIDDPIDASLADNPDQCKIINNWIAKVLISRLNDKAKGSVLLVMQRICIWDTTAFLTKLGGWDVLSLPAVTNIDRDVPLGDGEVYHWKQGELLHPDFLTEEILAEQLQLYGEADYAAQYLQSPVPSGGGKIDLGLFRRFSKLPIERDCRFLSIDAASGLEGKSYSVVLACQITNGQLFVFAHYRGKPTIPDLAKIALEAQKDLAIDHIVIENASGGQALIQLLDQHYHTVNGNYDHWRDLLWKTSPSKSKILRMEKGLIHAKRRRILLPHSSKWLPGFEEELRAFPKGEDDDQVDALSQAIHFFDFYMNHGLYGKGVWPPVPVKAAQ